MRPSGRVRRPPGPAPAAAARAILAGDGIDPDFFTRTAERFPRIAHVHLGTEHLYLLSHPEPARQVLVELSRQTTKSRGLQGARRILGTGLLTSEEPQHRQVRRLVAPAFHADRVAGYTADMVAAAERVGDRWQPGDRLDVAAQMGGLTFAIVGRSLFGADLDPDVVRRVRAALADLLAAYNRAFLPWFDLSLRLGTPLGRRVRAAAETLDAVILGVIARRRASAGNGDEPGGDLLGALLPELSDPQLRDEVMTLLLAGHETTAAALTMAWYLIGTHPPVRAWWDEELSRGWSPEQGIAALPRTRAIVAETLRLYPPAWTLGRRFAADVVLDGWSVPAGSSAVMSQWVLHRDGRFWARPHAFAPERWIGADGGFDDAAPGQPRGAYFPFGAGNRMCLGESFAWTEAVAVLATLGREWRVRPDGDRPRMRAAITLRPAGPVPVTLHPA